MPTLAEYRSYVQLPQVRAALDTIAWAEGGRYNNVYGGGTFSGNQHPNRLVTAGGYSSTAAGRYQFLFRTWNEVKNRLGMADFSPANQDIAAVDLIRQRGQLSNLLSGNFEGVLRGLGCAWAALPYATCGQKMRPLAQTMNYYRSALSAYGGKSAVANLPASTGGIAASIGTVGLVAAGVIAMMLILDD